MEPQLFEPVVTCPECEEKQKRINELETMIRNMADSFDAYDRKQIFRGGFDTPRHA